MERIDEFLMFLAGTSLLLGILFASDTSSLLRAAVAIAGAIQLARLAQHPKTLPVGEAAAPAPRPTPNISALSFEEASQTFKTNSNEAADFRLCRQLNELIAATKNNRKERDSDYQFFRNIVQHVGIGLLTFKKDGAVQIINSAARKLLRVGQIGNISQLTETSPTLVEAFQKLKTGGRELIRLRIGDDTIQLSVFAIELTLRGEEIKLISMSNLLPVIAKWDVQSGIVALVKPQFEAGKKIVSRGDGVVSDPEVHRQVLIDVLTIAKAEGFGLRVLFKSTWLRPKGNSEFLVWLDMNPNNILVEELVNGLFPSDELDNQDELSKM